jgi:hypothetical protein
VLRGHIPFLQVHCREKSPSAVGSLNEEHVVLRGKKFLTSAVVAACVVFGSGVAATSAQAISYSIPQGQELYAWDYFGEFLVELDPDAGSATPVGQGLVLSEYIDGGGYDPVTESNWILGGDCTLWITDSLDSPQFSLPDNYSNCFAFFPNGDGTAYVSAVDSAAQSMEMLLKVDLMSDGILSVIPVAPATALQITGLSKSPSGDYWISILGVGLAQINFSDPENVILDNDITLPYDVWDIAFDEDGILWLTEGPENPGLKAIDLSAPDPISTVFSSGSFGNFSGTNAMWFPDAYTYGSQAPSPSPSDSSVTPAGAASGSLAATGVNLGGYLMLSGVVVGLGILGIWLSRRKSS